MRLALRAFHQETCSVSLCHIADLINLDNTTDTMSTYSMAALNMKLNQLLF